MDIVGAASSRDIGLIFQYEENIFLVDLKMRRGLLQTISQIDELDPCVILLPSSTNLLTDQSIAFRAFSKASFETS